VLPVWFSEGGTANDPAADEELKFEHKVAIHRRSRMKNAFACLELLYFFSTRGIFLTLLKLSCQQVINQKAFNYSLTILHRAAQASSPCKPCANPLYSKKPHAALPKTAAGIPGSCSPVGNDPPASPPLPLALHRHFPAGRQLLGTRLLGAVGPCSPALRWGLGGRQSPSRGAGCYRFGDSADETISYLLGMIDGLSFRKGENESLREPETGCSLRGNADKLRCVQTGHSEPARLFDIFPRQFPVVRYSQIIVIRKNVSIKIRILFLRKPN